MRYWLLVLAFLVAGVNAVSIDDRIEQYLLSHPDVIARALEIHADNINKERISNIVTRGDNDIVIVNPEADSVLIAYIDYRCGACKRSYPLVQEFAMQHRDVALIIRPLPVLGGDAATAALMMYEAREKGVAKRFSEALFDASQAPDKELLYTLAKQFQIKVPLMIMLSQHWAFKHLETNYEQSASLDNQSVPLYVLAKGSEYRLFKGLSSVKILEQAYEEMK